MAECDELSPFERAEAALRQIWADEAAAAAQPRDRYCITFRSGWLGCSEVMQAVGRVENSLEDVEWSHAGGVHAVRFTCTWDVLKGLQAAVKSSCVGRLKCTRA